jgi:4-amino-4-deoxy-L-arabinose transferase-like glycosyltransferase
MGFAKFRDLVTSVDSSNWVKSFAPILWDDNFVFYLITRSICALLGALTVVPVYFTSKKLFGDRAAIFAAFVMALIPYHVHHSHFALIDVPMTLFLACSLYYAACILENPLAQNYVLSGVFAGLAASTKYNGVLILLAPVLAHAFRVFKNREKLFNLPNISNILTLGFFSILAFFVGTPFALLDYKNFSRTDSPIGALWQFTNVGSVPVSQFFTQVWDVLRFKFPDDLGVTFAGALYFIIIFTIFRFVIRRQSARDQGALFLIIPWLIFTLIVSKAELYRSHYFMITYPMAALLIGYFLAQFYENFVVRGPFLIIVPFLILGIPAYSSYLKTVTFVNTDTRVGLYEYAKKNTNPLVPVAIEGDTLMAVGKSYYRYVYDGVSKVSLLQHGYVFIAEDENFDWELASLKSQRPSAVERAFFDNKLRRGPKIHVYSF